MIITLHICLSIKILVNFLNFFIFLSNFYFYIDFFVINHIMPHIFVIETNVEPAGRPVFKAFAGALGTGTLPGPVLHHPAPGRTFPRAARSCWVIFIYLYRRRFRFDNAKQKKRIVIRFLLFF